MANQFKHDLTLQAAEIANQLLEISDTDLEGVTGGGYLYPMFGFEIFLDKHFIPFYGEV